MRPGSRTKLRKELTLFDVFAISTGAMFSSGFFLLPGIAAANAGPSVVLAYLLASVLVIPPMLSKAELSTAMPRSGGTYYFLDRSLGPTAGTIAGLGTWLALILKSAFALVGMGAYLAIFVHLPIRPVAVALALAFVALNVVGAKESSRLQRGLVIVLLAILGYFIAQGLVEIVASGPSQVAGQRFRPFLPFGANGLFSTVGLVFVSYIGLTKVASVSEEIRDPDRNIPLGMWISLLVTTFVYVVGVFIIVAVLDPGELRSDLTPVATAAQVFFDWLPGQLGLVLIVVAAVAAFASTGNAGIMSASRYPLAMAKDHLVWRRFGELGRFRTPTVAICVTGAVVVFCILAFDVEAIAKLASAFQLLMFGLVNLAVIVMRESGLAAYDPGYRSPLYPWMQIVGLLAPALLIAEMGLMPVVFSTGLVGVGLAWYFLYAHERVRRRGAVLHWFERLGRDRFEGLDRELRSILKEKGPRLEDPFDQIVARARVIDMEAPVAFEEAARAAASQLAQDLPVESRVLAEGFLAGTRVGATPVSHGAALPHLRIAGIETPHMAIVRCREGLTGEIGPEAPREPVQAVFFLVSPEELPGQHLRLLAHIAGRVDEPSFQPAWLAAATPEELRRTLVRDERFLTLRLEPDSAAASLIGHLLRETRLPKGTLVALIRRDGESFVPGGDARLREGDLLTVVGDPEAIEAVRGEFGA